MPTIDFSDDEHAAVTRAVRRTIDDDRFPHAPRLARRSSWGGQGHDDRMGSDGFRYSSRLS
jgi:hypothetical protein